MNDFVRPILNPPGGQKKVLLHSCCAPCSGEVMEAMLASGVDYTIFFYNPNIHPEREYLLRKDENVRFAEKHGVGFIDADYDKDNWFARAKGMEWEPERGARCTMCFDMRFERTALYAHEHGFPVITSSLGISRWKVGWLLVQARERGIVRIEIVHPRARRLGAERALVERFGLKDAVVVPAPDEPGARARDAGRAQRGAALRPRPLFRTGYRRRHAARAGRGDCGA